MLASCEAHCRIEEFLAVQHACLSAFKPTEDDNVDNLANYRLGTAVSNIDTKRIPDLTTSIWVANSAQCIFFATGYTARNAHSTLDTRGRADGQMLHPRLSIRINTQVTLSHAGLVRDQRRLFDILEIL